MSAAPVQPAFVFLLAGIWLAGALGSVHAFALAVFIFTLALLIKRSCIFHLAPFFALAAVGILRFGLASQPPIPLPKWIALDVPVVANIQIQEIVKRSDKGTVARGALLATKDENGAWIKLSPPCPVTVRYSELMPVIKDSEIVARGKFRSFTKTSDSVTRGWFYPVPPTTFSISKLAHSITVGKQPKTVGSQIDRGRLALQLRLTSALTGDVKDLVIAVLLGEGGGIAPEVRQSLSAIGTAHVLAVSGLHVAAAASIVGFLVYTLFGPVIVRLFPTTNLTKITMIIAAIAAGGMATLAGWSPSATRAAVMCMAAAYAISLGRGQALASVICIVAIMALIHEPTIAFSLSFLMSYGAVFSLAFLVPPLQKICGKSNPLKQALIASLAATIGTLPATVLAFGVAAPFGPFINLLIVPTAGILLMPCALFLAFTATVAPFALEHVAPPVQWVLEFWLGSQQWLSMVLPKNAWAFSHQITIILPIAAFFIALRLAISDLKIPIIASLAFACILVPWPRAPQVPPNQVAVTFLDVGKGDAMLVHCENNKTWLLDTAQELAAYKKLLPELRSQGVTKLEGIILTHADEDHVGGTLAVVTTIPVNKIAAPCVAMDEEPLKGFLERARPHVNSITCLKQGDNAIPECGKSTKVLWPPLYPNYNRNAASLVFKLITEDHTVLLTGDLETPIEKLLIADQVDLSAEFLKLGHHGSPGASSIEFLKAVSPKLAISTGIPVAGKPALSTKLQDRLSQLGIEVKRTYDQGWLRLGPW